MKVKYEFIFENDRTEIFDLSINDIDFNLTSLSTDTSQKWTRLDCNKCSVCPLDSSEHEHCPVALNLSAVVERFSKDLSYDQARIRVTIQSRVTEKFAPLFEGVSPLMGLIMATSGCPILSKFKPMAYTHLPFANETETILRAVGMYLTAQHLRMKKNLEPDWKMDKFQDMYAAVNQLNIDFSERLSTIQSEDANINALILLDMFAQVGTFFLTDDWIQDIEYLFDGYFHPN
jgi:hypothetical protein